MAEDGAVSAPQPFRRVDTVERRRATVVYFAMAGVAAAIATATGIGSLWWSSVAPLALLGVYQLLGGWKLNMSDMESIATAGRHVSFPIGHGSTTLGFRGFRARPVWQVLLFEDGPAPRHQALVTIDAVSGEVTGTFEEAVREP